MPRALFCVSSERRHTLWQARSEIASQTQKCRSPEKRTCRSCSSHRRLSGQARGTLPYYRGDGQSADQGPAYLVPLLSRHRRASAITFLQQFCDKPFPEAVEYLLTFQGKVRDAPVKQKQSPSMTSRQKSLHCHRAMQMTAAYSLTFASAASPRR